MATTVPCYQALERQSKYFCMDALRGYLWCHTATPVHLTLIKSAHLDHLTIHVDAFTNEPFNGNSTEVIVLTHEQAEQLSVGDMQLMAQENNLTETAFISPTKPGETCSTATDVRLHTFSWTQEMQLCGHGILAATIVLTRELGNEPDSLCVRTCYGAVASWRERTNAEMYNITECALRLPAVPPDDPLPSCCSEGFTSAFIEALVGDLPVADVLFSASLGYLIVELRSQVTPKELWALDPDARQLRRLGNSTDLVGAVVALAPEQAIENGGDEGIDVLSRYFGPWCGVDEDPVTGSAHCVLAPHFCRKLQRGNLRAQQGSRRTGTLRMACEEGSDFVVLRGSGVVVKRGDSMLPPRKGAPKQPEPLPPVTPELSTE